jgi:hypothetical protein
MDFMTRLSKCEKETIWRTSQGDSIYSIYTFDSKLKKRLKEFARKYPQCCRQIRRRFMFPGAEMYELEKARLTFRLDPPPTEEKKQRARENGKRNGFGKE